MYFQTLDDKNECLGVYLNGEIYYGKIPEGITKTWAYSPFLSDREVEYANLYCGGSSLEDVVPTAYADRWELIQNKLKAYFRSFNEAKVDLNENCFFDLVPERFLLEFCEIKNKITETVLQNYEKPEDYEFMLNLTKVVESMKSKKLNIDVSNIKTRLFEFKARQWKDKVVKGSPYISYDIYGTKTGRMTTKKNSFPILTLPKEYRSVIKPTNDWFVELDFNAAELRTLLSLAGREQPEGDIHNWNIENIFKESMSREKAKKSIFAWLYNPSMKHPAEKVYNRTSVLDKHWDGDKIQTIYGREIEADKHHALNYVIQSTTSDLFLRRMIDVHEILKNKKSHIAFCVHDSLVIDLDNEEKDMIPEIKKIFSDTELGNFKVNLSAGKDYGTMKELKI